MPTVSMSTSAKENGRYVDGGGLVLDRSKAQGPPVTEKMLILMVSAPNLHYNPIFLLQRLPSLPICGPRLLTLKPFG